MATTTIINVPISLLCIKYIKTLNLWYLFCFCKNSNINKNYIVWIDTNCVKCFCSLSRVFSEHLIDLMDTRLFSSSNRCERRTCENISKNSRLQPAQKVAIRPVLWLSHKSRLANPTKLRGGFVRVCGYLLLTKTTFLSCCDSLSMGGISDVFFLKAK